jgi:hypothetical protein
LRVAFPPDALLCFSASPLTCSALGSGELKAFFGSFSQSTASA